MNWKPMGEHFFGDYTSLWKCLRNDHFEFIWKKNDPIFYQLNKSILATYLAVVFNFLFQFVIFSNSWSIRATEQLYFQHYGARLYFVQHKISETFYLKRRKLRTLKILWTIGKVINFLCHYSNVTIKFSVYSKFYWYLQPLHSVLLYHLNLKMLYENQW